MKTTTQRQVRMSNLSWAHNPDEWGMDYLQVLSYGLWYTMSNYSAAPTDDSRKLAEMQRWAYEHNIILV